MKHKIILLSLFAFILNCASGQFAPPAGYEGSTAIHADSSIIFSWGENVVITRGLLNVSNPSPGYADYGLDSDALFAADNFVVSLGDGGMADYFFTVPIVNGEGPDFAVFENSFTDSYLELCFVEVSSDGVTYFRFNATSLTPTDVQVGSFGIIDATNINNLGGKYRGMFGTPFDLEELKEIPGLDVQNIINIRLIDVVGSIDPLYCTYDFSGNKINEPWPTEFPSSGFDLDALGVINSKLSGINESVEKSDINIYPNPASDYIKISGNIPGNNVILRIINSSGVNVLNQTTNSISNLVSIKYLPAGLYTLVIIGEINICKKFVILH